MPGGSRVRSLGDPPGAAMIEALGEAGYGVHAVAG